MSNPTFLETMAAMDKAPERFHCPFPGCGRSFAELWRLKVHYRAPSDGKGSGVERGHNMELPNCPKCGAALEPRRHHTLCAAGLVSNVRRRVAANGQPQMGRTIMAPIHTTVTTLEAIGGNPAMTLGGPTTQIVQVTGPMGAGMQLFGSPFPNLMPMQQQVIVDANGNPTGQIQVTYQAAPPPMPIIKAANANAQAAFNHFTTIQAAPPALPNTLPPPSVLAPPPPPPTLQITVPAPGMPPAALPPQGTSTTLEQAAPAAPTEPPSAKDGTEGAENEGTDNRSAKRSRRDEDEEGTATTSGGMGAETSRGAVVTSVSAPPPPLGAGAGAAVAPAAAPPQAPQVQVVSTMAPPANPFPQHQQTQYVIQSMPPGVIQQQMLGGPLMLSNSAPYFVNHPQNGMMGGQIITQGPMSAPTQSVGQQHTAQIQLPTYQPFNPGYGVQQVIQVQQGPPVQQQLQQAQFPFNVQYVTSPSGVSQQ